MNYNHPNGGPRVKARKALISFAVKTEGLYLV